MWFSVRCLSPGMGALGYLNHLKLLDIDVLRSIISRTTVLKVEINETRVLSLLVVGMKSRRS